MPDKEHSWNPADRKGNPTRSNEVNNLIKKIRDFDAEVGGAKKRKSLMASSSDQTTPTSSKMARASLPAGFAPAVMPQAPSTLSAEGSSAIQSVLRQMQSQNASFMHLFGSLSQTLDNFQTTLRNNNEIIENELRNLTHMSASIAIAGAAQPNATTESQSVATGTLDWQYVHPDGIRRRVPPTVSVCSCKLLCLSKLSWSLNHKAFMYLSGRFPTAASRRCTSSGTAETTKIESVQ